MLLRSLQENILLRELTGKSFIWLSAMLCLHARSLVWLDQRGWILAARSSQPGMPKMEARMHLSCNMRSSGCTELESVSSISTADSRCRAQYVTSKPELSRT